MIGSRPLGRRVLAAILASTVAITGLVTVNPVAASAQAGALARCYKTKQSTVYLQGIADEYEFDTTITVGGTVTVEPRTYFRKDVKLGYAAVTIIACKPTKKKAWYALYYSVSTNLRDLKLITTGTKVDGEPVNNDRGYAAMIAGVTKAKTIVFNPTVCTKKPEKLSVIGAVKFLTGLPIPVSPTKAVGLWVVSNGLKEKDSNGNYSCGLLGKATAVPFKFTSTGVAKLKMPSTGHYLFTRRATWTNVCPLLRYCGTSRDEVIEVKAGKQ